MITALEFANKCKSISKNYKFVYMYGCFGQPVTASLIEAKSKQYPSFYTAAKRAELKKLIGKGYFGTDCIGLVKMIFWDWSGDPNKSNGGAKYASNGVPDINADTMITKCKSVTTDFSNIEIGEFLWIPQHCGIYIGNGLAVECSPKWKNSVQITAVGNIGAKPGYNTRTWDRHGRLPYISYSTSSSSTPTNTRPEPAKAYSKAYSRSYTVTAGALNLRRGAGITKKTIKVLKRGDKVRCFGYYTNIGPTPWFYVQTSDGVVGYCSSRYLK